jgi:multidrug resistance efflux pump
VQLDLVNLANSVADASGAVRIAEAQLKDAMERVNAGGAGRTQVATAEATFAAARNRQELLRGIARLALEGAAQDLDRLQKLSKQGVVSVEELGKREALVGMLKLIVRAADDGGGRGGAGVGGGGARPNR